VYLKILAR
jgi:hypothetical protein